MKSATARSVKTREAGPGAARRRAGEPLSAPGPAGSLLHLQRTAGNQAVGTLLATPHPQLQAQLRIGQPGDAFEREADRVADAVAGPAAPRGKLPGISQIHGAGGGALRRCARCGGDRSAGDSGGPPAATAAGAVQRKCQCEQGNGDELMQGRETPGAAPRVPAGFTAQLAGLRGAGTPLSPAQRSFFEPRFSHDFSAVRLHTGALAESSAEAVRARAFTLGNDVVFGRGEYAPDSPSGRHLLAHELTHVVQQTPMVRRQPFTPDAGGQTSLLGGMGTEDRLDRSGTLPYRQAVELQKCIHIMGEANAEYCREEVLGEKPTPHINWSVTQSNTDGTASTKYSSTVSINFLPDPKWLHCDEIAFVQNVRLINPASKVSQDPDQTNKQRITTSGWSIDRAEARKYGWYGYNNDGKPSGTVTPGKSPPPTTATMKDTPAWNVANLQWDFETCSICKAGTDAGEVYGCLGWGFDVDGSYKLKSHPVVESPAPSAEFKAAVKQWNAQAKKPAAKRNDPNQQPLGPFK
jgi:hypothetical protein